MTFINIATGGAITRSLSDGSEVSRLVPEGGSELTPLFDAMHPPPPSGSDDKPDR